MRLVLAFVFSVLPGLGLAATLSPPVAEYFAQASLRLSISAVFQETGEGAVGALSGGVPVFDFRDFDGLFPSEGTGTQEFVVSGDFPIHFTSTVTAAGFATDVRNDGTSSLTVYDPAVIEYRCQDFGCTGDNILLALDYVISTVETKWVDDPNRDFASVFTGAVLRASQLRLDELGLPISGSRFPIAEVNEGKGTLFSLLSPGDALFFAYELSAIGSAESSRPEVIPLPASAFVLMSGLAFLGALGVRRRRP